MTSCNGGTRRPACSVFVEIRRPNVFCKPVACVAAMLVADNLRNHSRHRLLLCRGRGLYLDPKWLSYSDEVAVGPGGVRVLHRSPVPVPIIALDTCVFVLEVSRGRFRTPRSNARPREGERRCLWSPRLMGGLAGGRVRSRDSRGIPKKRSGGAATRAYPALRIIRVHGKSCPSVAFKRR